MGWLGSLGSLGCLCDIVLMSSCTALTSTLSLQVGGLCAQTLEKVKGIEVLTEACNACKAAIDKRKGRLVVKEAARAVRPSATLGRGHGGFREQAKFWVWFVSLACPLRLCAWKTSAFESA